MTTNWTKFSDKLPEEDVRAVFLLNRFNEVSLKERPSCGSWDSFGNGSTASWWHPITYPEVPKEEQKKKDDVALEQWLGVGPYSYYCAWHAALRYERAEVAKELDGNKWGCYEISGERVMASINRLRRRCGLDK